MLINTCSLTEMCRRTLLFIVIVAVIVSPDETERGREKRRGKSSVHYFYNFTASLSELISGIVLK